MAVHQGSSVWRDYSAKKKTLCSVVALTAASVVSKESSEVCLIECVKVEAYRVVYPKIP